MNFIKNILTCLLILLSNFWVLAQETKVESPVLDYARQVIDTLCAPGMHGRGYVQEGDRVAARYIAAEYERLGLKKLGRNKSFFQPFRINVQTFPKKMSVKIGRKSLAVGKDFLVDPASNGVKGRYKIKFIKEKKLYKKRYFNKLLEKDYSDSFFLVENKTNQKSYGSKLDSLQSLANVAGIVAIENKKLTWHISSEVQPTPKIIVLNNSLPSYKQSIELDIDSEYLTDYETQNVIGYVEGTEQPDSFFVFSAHYDHLGRLGADQYIPGANDNAAGVAMLLGLAKYYQANPPKYSIAFMAFGGEEVGLLGSKYFVEHPLLALKSIKFLLNCDLVGTGSEGITAVHATEFPLFFEKMMQINEQYHYVNRIKRRGKAANSDHWPFYLKGVPGFFIYAMGGIQAYHDIYDRAETLPLTEFEDIMQLFKSFLAKNAML